jgi:hypothetical protein
LVKGDSRKKTPGYRPFPSLLRRTGEYLFYPTFEIAAFEEHPVPAGQALNADISTEPVDPPFIAAAGMFFPEAENIADFYI